MIRQLINIVYENPTGEDDEYKQVTTMLAQAIALFAGDVIAAAARNSDGQCLVLALEAQNEVPERVLDEIFQRSCCDQLVTMLSNDPEVTVRSIAGSDGEPLAPMLSATGLVLDSETVRDWEADAAVIPIAEMLACAHNATVH
jgi:hypothetical protein